MSNNDRRDAPPGRLVTNFGLGTLGASLFVCAVAAGTVLDRPPESFPESGILVGDFHVHPHPVDGGLTVGQLRREARRRGLDVIALTPHNNAIAWSLAWDDTRDGLPGADSRTPDVIVLPGQEITAATHHIAAIGIESTIDWRLSVRETAEEVHRLGGAIIAAHPVDQAWQPRDPASLSALDGVEVAHPILEMRTSAAAEIGRFYESVRAVNPDVAPIGSSDFHAAAPLGRCRTYVFVAERTPAGVIAAIRTGRTVAEAADGQLIGMPDLVARATAYRAARPYEPAAGGRVLAVMALAGLALFSANRR